MPSKKPPAAWDLVPGAGDSKSQEFEMERLKAQLAVSRQKIKELQQKCRDATNRSRASVDHHEQIMALEQAHKRTIKNMQQHINAKTKELQKLQEDTKAQRLVVETTRLKQELKQRELALDFLKKRSSDRDAINKELVKRTIAFPTRFVRTVDELEMEVVRMARLHQRELKTLKVQLAARPGAGSGAGGDSGDEEGRLGADDAVAVGGDGGGEGGGGGGSDGGDSGGEGDDSGGGDGRATTRVEALTLQLHARNETIREVLKEKEGLYKQVHELKMVEDRLARTKVKYKMSQDVVAQLQDQLLTISQERDDATDAQQRLEIELEFLRTEAERSRDEINGLHAKSMENIRVLKARELNLQYALEEQQEQNEKLKRAMNMSKKTLSRKVKDVEQSKAGEMKKSSTIAMKLAHLQTELEDKNKLIFQMMQEKGAARAPLGATETKRADGDIVGDAVELKTMLMKARADAAGLKGQLQISEHRARTLEQEQKKAQAQITAFKLQTRQLQKQADKTAERAQDLQQQLEASQRQNRELLERLNAVQHSNRVLDRTKGDMDIDSHHGGDEPEGDGSNSHRHHRNNDNGDSGDNNNSNNNPNDSSGHQLLSEINSTLRANSEIAGH